MIDLPIVENRTSAPSNPVEDQCYYNSNWDSYWIYLNNSWQLIEPKNEDDTFVLQYKTTDNLNWTATEYTDWTQLQNAVTSLKNTSTNINIYYGTLSQPTQRCRIISSIGNNEEDFARIERWKLINNIYTWEAVAVIYPKIIFNNQTIEHTIFNNNTSSTFETTYFNDVLVHKLYPKIELQIIETSSPANSTIGYIPGENISLTYKYTNKGTLFNLNNVHLWSDDNLNTPIDTIVNLSSLGQTGTFTRTYTVTKDDCISHKKIKSFYFKMFYENEYDIKNDILSIKDLHLLIAHEIPYWDVVYTDINNNTVSQRFYQYDDILIYLNQNVTTNLQDISITEGWEYE